MHTDYNVGDRVICTNQYGNVMVGETGTFVYKKRLPPEYGIRWDKKHDNRHSCSRHCEDKYGYYVTADCIKLDIVQDLGDFSSNLALGSVSDLIGG